MRMYLSAAILGGVCLVSSVTHAASVAGKDWLDAERFQVRGRAILVAPDEDSKVSVGGKARASNSWAPEADISYYFTDFVSAEVIAATTRHSLSHDTAGRLGRTWILPPTVTVQYHPLPREKFSPYVGAGLNYSVFYGEKSAAGVSDLDVDGGVGYAFQAGADYWIDEHWGVNFDVKKIYLNVDANMNVGGTPVRADVDLDPWVIGAGVSYRF